MVKRIALLTIVLVAAILPTAAQSRTNRIYRFCTGSTMLASVEIERDGDVNFTPCSGRTVSMPSTSAFRLVDNSFTPFLSATNYFSIGSNSTITPGNVSWIPMQTYFTLDMTGSSSKFKMGSYTRIRTEGATGGGNGVYGHVIAMDASHSSGTEDTVAGVFASTDIQRPVTNGYGGIFSASHTSSGASGSVNIYGIQATAGMSHNGTLTNAFSGDFHLLSTPSTASTTDLGVIIRGRLTNQTGVTVTDLRGLSFSGWTNTGTIGTSYAMYFDNSVGIGSTNWLIYSLATSPSFFAGKHTFDVTNTAGGTTGNQTINKPSFSVNFAAGSSSLVVTNSFITLNSYVLCTVQTNDATAVLKNATPAAGSVTIRLNANATAETRVACLVTN